MEIFEFRSCIRGYHIYYRIWDAVIEEVLDCQRETTNSEDGYAVAVIKDGTIIGHVPLRISKLCSLFLR